MFIGHKLNKTVQYNIIFLNLYSAIHGRDHSVLGSTPRVKTPRVYRYRFWEGRGMLKEIQTARLRKTVNTVQYN